MWSIAPLTCSLVSSPPPPFPVWISIVYTSIHYSVYKGEGVWGHRKEGSLRHTKHLPRNPFTCQFFYITTFGIAFFQSSLSSDKSVAWAGSMCTAILNGRYPATPPSPHPPRQRWAKWRLPTFDIYLYRIWAHIWGCYWPTRIDDISLWPLESQHHIEYQNSTYHWLNMELDLQSLFGFLCTAVLSGWDPATPPPPPSPPHLGLYTRVLLVIQDGRHLFVTLSAPASQWILYQYLRSNSILHSHWGSVMLPGVGHTSRMVEPPVVEETKLAALSRGNKMATVHVEGRLNILTGKTTSIGSIRSTLCSCLTLFCNHTYWSNLQILNH